MAAIRTVIIANLRGGIKIDLKVQLVGFGRSNFDFELKEKLFKLIFTKEIIALECGIMKNSKLFSLVAA